MLSKKRKNDLGFTLIELLLVVAIIGILSSLAVVNLNQARAKARDAKRLSDIGQVRKALEVYYYANGEYPNTECYNLPGLPQCTSILRGPDWIDDLEMDLPVDPINIVKDGTPYTYWYTRDLNRSTDYENYYYLMFSFEASETIDTCNNNPWSGFSCIGGGDVPPDPNP